MGYVTKATGVYGVCNGKNIEDTSDSWKRNYLACIGQYTSHAHLKLAVDEWIDNSQNANEFYGDISQWNTSSITSRYYMFRGATNLNGDFSEWDTSSVTNMVGTFQEAPNFNGD